MHCWGYKNGLVRGGADVKREVIRAELNEPCNPWVNDELMDFPKPNLDDGWA